MKQKTFLSKLTEQHTYTHTDSVCWEGKRDTASSCWSYTCSGSLRCPITCHHPSERTNRVVPPEHRHPHSFTHTNVQLTSEKGGTRSPIGP